MVRPKGVTVSGKAPAIRSHFDAGLGHALFVVGESQELGGWNRALPMTYDAKDKVWSFESAVLLKGPFKIARGPWTEGRFLPVSRVQIESGENRYFLPQGAEIEPRL
jgi:hypothetical protein